MKSYEKLLLENKSWVQERLQIDANYFKNLAKGEHPDFLWIGPSDSRISPDQLVNAEPGEILVHRNIGNLVVHTDLNLLSAVEYAVTQLEVNHIIVCGTYNSNAIKAALGHQKIGLIDKWIRYIKDVYRLYEAELDAITDNEERGRRLAEFNVKEQVFNLAKTSIIQKAWKDRQNPCLHGWIFEPTTGLIKDMFTMNSNSEINGEYAYHFS
ncbi:MAG: carbonic anhydrase [Cyclobacteriaceae bacterium]|nr:carbonic anhydrase [Cyclobacteriaceae bacterium HetDA_MAG_MS6]